MSRFFAKMPQQGTGTVDALQSPWPRKLIYAFKLETLDQRVLQGGKQLETDIIVISHPRRPWFPDSLQQLSIQPHWVLPKWGIFFCGDPQLTRFPTDNLELERSMPSDLGFSDRVTKTMLASWKAFTSKVYRSNWLMFTRWAASKGFLAVRAKVKRVLAFWQEGLEKSLSTKTLKRQLTAIRTVLGAGLGTSLASRLHMGIS